MKGTNIFKYLMICILTLLLGAAAGAVIWAILQIMDAGISFFWDYLPQKTGMQKSLIYNLTVCLSGGLIIGSFQKKYGILPDNMEEVMELINNEGSYPYDRLHIIAVAALLPLIFGGSLGPEAGLSGLIAGLCCWIGDKLKYKGDQLAALTESGFAATLGVIFGSPVFGIVHNLEPNNQKEHYREKLLSKKYRIIIYCFGVAGSMLSIKGLGLLPGIKSTGLPRFEARHAVGADQWKWVIPLIITGIAFSFFYMICTFLSNRLASKLQERRVASCLLAGILVALSGYFLPLTMFSGESQLHDMIGEWHDYAPWLLAASAVIKLFLTSFCISLGWKGGSIFPIIFCGAMAGFSFALLTGMDGGFAASVVIASLYSYMNRKPLASIAALLLCFPVTYILPVAVSAFIASKIPNPLSAASLK